MNIELLIAELVQIVPDLALEIPENREAMIRSIINRYYKPAIKVEMPNLNKTNRKNLSHPEPAI